MTRAHTVHLNPPWTRLHDRDVTPPTPVKARARAATPADRAMNARRTSARLESVREKAFRDMTMCSRPYL
jgi:hypothetical protein